MNELRRELWEMIDCGRRVWKLTPIFHRILLGFSLVIIALGAIANIAPAILIGRLLDRTNALQSSSSFPTGLLPLLGYVALAYLGREILQLARRFLVEASCTRMEKMFFITLVAKLLKADLTTVHADKLGAIHGRIHRSVIGSVRFLRLSFLDLVPAIASGCFALLAVTWKQPLMGILMLGLVPLSLWVTLKQLVSQKDVRLDLMHTREAMDGTLVEQISGIDYIRAAGTHDREIRRAAEQAERLRRKEVHHHGTMSLFGSFKALQEGMFHVMILSLAIYLAYLGWASLGDILAFSMLFHSVMSPLNEVHRVIDEAHECSISVRQLLHMMAQPIDRSLETEYNDAPSLVIAPEIKIQNLRIDFKDNDGGGRRGIHDASLTIQHGDFLGIAGPSGSGKSTMVRAVLRMIHPNQGDLSIGGVPLSEISRENLAETIAYVGQTPFLFAGTIEANIAYERPDASFEQIVRAARAANFHDEIVSMQSGYKTVLSEHGQNLSGGQKQRIALARAFLKDSPILILDEATSALDMISEHRVQKSLRQYAGKKTIILIAHRLSTLQYADRIVVFDEGEIAELGRYDELVARNGLFAELVRNASHQGDLQRDSLTV